MGPSWAASGLDLAYTASEPAPWAVEGAGPGPRRRRRADSPPSAQAHREPAAGAQGWPSGAAHAERTASSPVAASRREQGGEARGAPIGIAPLVGCVALLLLVAIEPGRAQSDDAANIKTVMGGSIHWHLEDDFETSRNVTFTMVTYWDQSEIAYEGTGVDVVIGEPIVMPSDGLSYAARFGNLKVQMGSYMWMFPNKYTVMSLEGDYIEGWLTVSFIVPDGAYTGNASLVGVDGGDLKRSASYVTSSVVTKHDPNGALPQCEDVGPSPIPCEVYLEHYRGVKGPNPNKFGFFTTISIPQLNETAKYYRGIVRNRNSARISSRPIVWVTDSVMGRTNSFTIPAYDRDGDPVTTFVAGSRQATSGSYFILCEQGNMTSFGCFGPSNSMDGPPYDSVNFLMSFGTEKSKNSPFFFYSFTFNVTDGATFYALTEILINYCRPVITIGQSSIFDRAAEFFDYTEAGEIVRRRPKTFMECDLAGPCEVTIYAGRFPDDTSTVPARHPDQQGQLEIVVAGSANAGHLKNQTIKNDGSVFRNFTFGKLPHGGFDVEEIGSHRVVCFTVTGHTKCKPPPLCITIKVRGSKPFFVAPTPPMVLDTDDVELDVMTPTPVCAGMSVSFEIRAKDPDAGESVTLDIYDNTGDGEDIFAEPYNAEKRGNYSGTSQVANAFISYELSYEKGVQRDPVTRAVAFARERSVCTVAVDDSRLKRFAFGDDNQERRAGLQLYRGNHISGQKCHLITFSGPPAFITSASRFDGSPFAAFDGTVEERMRTIDAFIGLEKSVTFRAKDPNFDGHATILILQDPGIPNGMAIGPSTCEPQFTPVTWNASGVYSECSIASRTLTWTPDPAVDTSRKYRICALARDSTPIPQCTSEKMTDIGWYGEEHCTEIQVIRPNLRWTNNSELGPIRNNTRNVFVPCATNFTLEAEEIGFGYNNTGHIVATPYQARIVFNGDVPERASLTKLVEGRVSRSVLSYTASRGDEGRTETICFTVRDDQLVVELPATCVTVHVKRCVYCVNQGDTLQRIMQDLALDFNWLRLWAANGNEDGDADTTTVNHPDDLMKTTRQHIINIGSVYTVEPGDSLALLAVKFQTTVKQILSLNPDVGPTGPSLEASTTELFGPDHYNIQVGQPLCIVPCTVLPRLPDDDLVATQ